MTTHLTICQNALMYDTLTETILLLHIIPCRTNPNITLVHPSHLVGESNDLTTSSCVLSRSTLPYCNDTSTCIISNYCTCTCTKSKYTCTIHVCTLFTCEYKTTRIFILRVQVHLIGNNAWCDSKAIVK